MIRSNLFYYICLTFCFLLVYPFIFDSKIFLGGDNANYYILGKSLSENFAYEVINTPNHTPANHFPPGYPFILAFAMKVGITSLDGLKILNGLFLLGTTFLTYGIANKLLSKKVLSALIALAFLLNYHALEYSTVIMSETCYTFFSMLCLFLILKFRESNHSIKSPYFIFLLICIGITIYIRTQGIAIFGGLIFYLLVIRHFKTAIISFIAVTLMLLPWQIRSHNLGGNSYVNQLLSKNPYDSDKGTLDFKDGVERIKKNFVRYTSKEIPSLVFPSIKPDYNTKTPKPTPVTHWIIGGLVLVFLLVGSWAIKELRWLLLSFFGANLLIFLLWPDVWYGIRFILPLLPFILIILIYGIKSSIGLFWKSSFVTSGNVMFIFIPIIILANFEAVKVLHEKSERPHAPNWSNYISMSKWCGENLKSSDLIVTRKPGLFYLESHAQTISIPPLKNVSSGFSHYDSLGVDYVILEQLGFKQTGQDLYPLLVKEPDRFELIHSIGARQIIDKQGNKTTTPDGVWLYKYSSDYGYRGSYENDFKSGKGMYLYRNGDTLTGTWINDTLNGEGIYYNHKNKMYQHGFWKNGKKEGVFILETSDNKRIETNWKGDKIDPQGYFIDENGKRIGLVKMN